MQWSPESQKMWQRFKGIRRGYISFWVFLALLGSSMFAELMINSRAIVVRYEGQLYFPTYSDFLAGTTFGQDYQHETNYRELKIKFAEEGAGNWVLMPAVPYNAFENDLESDDYPPHPPNFGKEHYLGTDTTGRDVLARLAYGFRIAIWFSLSLLVFQFGIGVLLGSIMGYFGGWFDLIFQRIIEIWSNVPFLYVVIILASITVPHFMMLVGINVFFGWMGMTWYLRTLTYKEKSRDYVAAARALGASHARIIIHHILPNAVSVIITFAPFAITAGISSLTALDYLGFGLPAPTPSWGELLSQGKQHLSAQWILGSVCAAMVIVLVMVTFIGEAVREAFDPKKFTVYE